MIKNNVEAILNMNIETKGRDSIFEILQLINDRGIRCDVIIANDIPIMMPLFKLTSDKNDIIKLLTNELEFDTDTLKEEVKFKTLT